MLKAKVLPQILQQATTNGVKSALLITMGGDLLASAGNDPSDKLVGALVSNIWNTYNQKTAVPDNLVCLLIENEQGRLAITKITKFLLCVYGGKNVEFGMLKAKVEALYKHLDEPFRQLELES